MIFIGYESGLDKLFLDKSWLFLRVLNYRWSSGEREAGYIARLFNKYGLSSGSKILDLGCGNGRIAIHLAMKGYRVVGVDYSKDFIDDARAKASQYNVEENVEFIVGDAREIDELFEPETFDATYLYWTTILGYYLDPEIDKMILEKIYRITRSEGYLFILNTASYESLAYLTSHCGVASYYTEIDDEIVLIEKPEPVFEESLMKTTWIFYRRRNRDLEYIDEISFKLRLYSFPELLRMAESTGWRYVEAYSSIASLTPYKPSRGFNIVFKKA